MMPGAEQVKLPSSSLIDVAEANALQLGARVLWMKFRRARDQLIVFAACPGLVDPTNKA